ncbi:hypothetical protein RRF57_001304 [Xylaria bambusicola]|uniref:Uncharacterized protein n=1 Tax=Xylaria bambusicola TaxID=326684 RepID=A0AAN7UGF7_9PEZI
MIESKAKPPITPPATATVVWVLIAPPLELLLVPVATSVAGFEDPNWPVAAGIVDSVLPDIISEGELKALEGTLDADVAAKSPLVCASEVTPSTFAVEDDVVIVSGVSVVGDGTETSLSGGVATVEVVERALVCVALDGVVILGGTLWEDVELAVLVKVSEVVLVDVEGAGTLMKGSGIPRLGVVSGVDVEAEDAEDIVDVDIVVTDVKVELELGIRVEVELEAVDTDVVVATPPSATLGTIVHILLFKVAVEKGDDIVS